MMTTIQIKTRLHEGIYKSSGGGEIRVVAEYSYGPRNLVKAYRELLKTHADNKRYYGNIGCGHTWMETTDGRTLDTTLAAVDETESHAEQVKSIEFALLTPEQAANLERAVFEHA